MKTNIGNLDKTVRLVLAIVLLFLFLSKVVTGVAGYGILLLAVVLTSTAFMGFCPLYSPFRINTRNEKQPESK